MLGTEARRPTEALLTICAAAAATTRILKTQKKVNQYEEQPKTELVCTKEDLEEET